MKGLGTRLLTGVVFVVAVVLATYAHPISFAILFFMVTALCLWEFYAIVLTKDAGKVDNSRKILAMITGLLPYTVIATSLLSGQILYKGLALTLASLVAWTFLLLVFELFAKAENPFTHFGNILLGAFYIGVPFALLGVIGLYEGFHPFLILGMLLLTWVNDSFAYLTGSLFGKTPLIPRISPKKTREGSLGGILFTLLGGYLLSLIFSEYTLENWMVISVLIAIFSSLGDLVESMLKRSYTVKDSGGLLPGHGGFLDRFDGFIFMVPFVFLYLVMQ
ncbi:MAG: phosphatidate cytidylyltransferase [Bacteroidota bacterium]